MKRRIHWPTCAFATTVAISIVGCNSILDNERGVLSEETQGALPSVPTDDGSAPPPTLPNEEDGGTTVPDTDGGTNNGCEAGKTLCHGLCVSINDPLYGCGDPSCSPCPSSHGTMGCAARKCVITACDPGYADCNAKPNDGCEVDLSKATSCGACNAVCGAAAPFCSPAGPTFQCTNGCTPVAPLACGEECVDPNTSINHCGGCNVKCATVANSTTTCTTGTCGFTCKAAFHACTGKCVAKTDPTACGADCLACPVPANGKATCAAETCGFTCNAGFTKCGDKCVGPNDPTACGAACTVCPPVANAAPTCTGATCGFACSAGFGNCDANNANGCETTFASDPLNCGMCGKACVAPQTCVAGTCQ